MIASELGRLTRRLHPSARPLAIVFLVPLAASCFLATPQSLGAGMREAPARHAEMMLLPERLREAIEAFVRDAKPVDPPIRSQRWPVRPAPQHIQAMDCAFALAQPGTPRFLTQTSETTLNAPRAGAHPRRGPPRSAT